MKKLLYEMCGCDACGWEVWNFELFYFFKDWEKKDGKWEFHWADFIIGLK